MTPAEDDKSWRMYPGKWPNGRAFWTVENRKTGQVRCGPNGGLTRFHDKAQAMAEASRLRGKATEDEPCLIE